MHEERTAVPTTLTIRNVSAGVAQALRRRAENNRRSLQRELLLIIERAASEVEYERAAAEPAHAYGPAERRNAPGGSHMRQGRLTLQELWQRARALGPAMPSESTAIVRRDRDAPDRR